MTDVCMEFIWLVTRMTTISEDEKYQMIKFLIRYMEEKYAVQK